MSDLMNFVSGSRPPKNIVNISSDGTVNLPNSVDIGSWTKKILAGATTANVFKTVLSVTGAGAISYLSSYRTSATTGTLSCRVTIDGIVVFNATTPVAANNGQQIIGSTGSYGVEFDRVVFNKSLLVELAESIAATSDAQINIVYQTF